MGAIAQNMEVCRDMRGVNIVEHGMQDLRFALRQLLINPGFACTAIVVLTLGIAATVTIFGFVDAALVQPLPYEDPSRLVHVFGARSETLHSQSRGSVSYQDFVTGESGTAPSARSRPTTFERVSTGRHPRGQSACEG